MVEVGLLGTCCAAVLALHLGRALLATAGRPVARGMAPTLSLSLVAMGAANAASFVVSHQTYSDILVVALSAAFVGMALASRQGGLPQRQGVENPVRPGLHVGAASAKPTARLLLSF
jgi:hypothetical protein